MADLRVGVLGATGYTGAVAAMLVDRHPSFELVYVTARSDAGVQLDHVHPRLRIPLTLETFDSDQHGDVDAAIVAYPHGAAAPVVAQLREKGVRVVDLSADFRLRDPAVYAQWYGDHGAPDLLDEAVYGLPELYREQIAKADLVANPGCYPTATLLALAPLARAGLIGDVIVDAKSGVSGAGRKPLHGTHFVTANEDMRAYKVEGHRHTPEIEQELHVLGASAKITFVPHLIPLTQGELVSCYVTPHRDTDDLALHDLYVEAYAKERWVELTQGTPGASEVRETNYCRVSVHMDSRTGRILVFASLDNLWKGAASQAIQNLNLMFGLDEGEGLA